MKFKDLRSSLYESVLGSNVLVEAHNGSSVLHETNNGIYIDYELTDYESLNEAISDLSSETDVAAIRQELCESYYLGEGFSSVVAEKLSKYGQVSDALVESYIDAALNKDFILDEALIDIRESNTFDAVNEKVDFVLNDGGHVSISFDTYNSLNSSFDDELKEDVVNYMSESVDNFIEVVDSIIGDKE